MANLKHWIGVLTIGFVPFEFTLQLKYLRLVLKLSKVWEPLQIYIHVKWVLGETSLWHMTTRPCVVYAHTLASTSMSPWDLTWAFQLKSSCTLSPHDSERKQWKQDANITWNLAKIRKMIKHLINFFCSIFEDVPTATRRRSKSRSRSLFSIRSKVQKFVQISDFFLFRS